MKKIMKPFLAMMLACIMSISYPAQVTMAALYYYIPQLYWGTYYCKNNSGYFLSLRDPSLTGSSAVFKGQLNGYGDSAASDAYAYIFNTSSTAEGNIVVNFSSRAVYNESSQSYVPVGGGLVFSGRYIFSTFSISVNAYGSTYDTYQR